MPTVHMIHGYLGAGKTTFAIALAARHNAMLFTHDEFMSTLYGNDPDPALFGDYKQRVDTLIDILWKRAVGTGIDVVLDLNFWSRSQRDAFREVSNQLGCTVVLYSMSCADDLALARVLARNNTDDNALYIFEATYRALRSRFEPLGEDEVHEPIITG